MPPVILNAALRYIERGYSVIPMNPLDHVKPKAPAIRSWKRYQLVPPTPEQAESDDWWGNGSRNRLAIVTGPVSHSLAVFDLDNIELANEVLEDVQFCQSYRVVQTPSGGLHFYLREEKPSGNNVRYLGVGDIRATGGYVGAPPSEGYKLLYNGSIHKVFTIKHWIEELFMPHFDIIPQMPQKGKLSGKVQQGSRNDFLFRIAASMRGQGRSLEAILACLRVENRDSCTPPLDDEEVVTIAESSGRYDVNADKLSEKPSYPEVANALREIHSIALVGGHGGQLAVYQDGVYRPGDAVIRSTATELLNNKWSTAKIDGVLTWLRDDARTPEIPDRPPLDKINVLNGLLNVRTREVEEHSPDNLSLIQLPIEYDPTKKCPAIDDFLLDVLPPELVPIFYEVAGWLMVPDITRKTAVLLWGPTDTGKSTAIELLQALLGIGNYSSISLQDLSDRFRPAELVGKLANFFDDLPNTTLKDSGTFKALTGRGTIQIERKFSHPYQVQPFARLVFATNEAPRTWDTTSAYFNRWLVLPFEREIPKKRQDRALTAKLTTPEELSGFFNKALAGLKRGAFSEAPALSKASEKFREKADPVSSFLAEKYDLVPTGAVMQRDLISSYRMWCISAKKQVVSGRELNEHLRNLPPWTNRQVGEFRRQGRAYWRGLERKKDA